MIYFRKKLISDITTSTLLCSESLARPCLRVVSGMPILGSADPAVPSTVLLPLGAAQLEMILLAVAMCSGGHWHGRAGCLPCRLAGTRMLLLMSMPNAVIRRLPWISCCFLFTKESGQSFLLQSLKYLLKHSEVFLIRFASAEKKSFNPNHHSRNVLQ